MDQLYEVALLISFACGAAALAVALLGRVQPARAVGMGHLAAAVGAWVALLVSVTVHVAWGHRPGGAQALPPLAFLGEHRSFIVAALIPALALVLRPGAQDNVRRGDRAAVSGPGDR